MKNLKSNLASNIDRIFAITIIVLLSIYSLVLTYYTDTLQKQLHERDILIEKLAKRDSILNKVFTLNIDSVTNSISYNYIERDGEVVKYDVLAKDLKQARNDLNEKLEQLSEALYVSNDLEEGLKVSEGKYDTLVYDYNKLVGLYNQLANDAYSNSKKADSVINLMNRSLDSMSVYKAFTKHLQENYGFKYTLDNNKRTIQIKNPSVDSAMILLPYFRKRLSYDNNKKVWVIEIDKE
ncbi:hypothetical protein [Algoriphagus sp.]|uniref:hypothetical protein n=1 Tax=Algoriphagus sp. TaxID=1872435 RepID=UPI00271D5D49|nr:hypothetical protein [Algoriphagus sp.]MDO8968631.1 hypothetical protein [Algoriphagus sp.]MDP3201366.1 hypothetical protein [Algoriphagus sp.]